MLVIIVIFFFFFFFFWRLFDEIFYIFEKNKIKKRIIRYSSQIASIEKVRRRNLESIRNNALRSDSSRRLNNLINPGSRAPSSQNQTNTQNGSQNQNGTESQNQNQNQPQHVSFPYRLFRSLFSPQSQSQTLPPPYSADELPPSYNEVVNHQVPPNFHQNSNDPSRNTPHPVFIPININPSPEWINQNQSNEGRYSYDHPPDDLPPPPPPPPPALDQPLHTISHDELRSEERIQIENEHVPNVNRNEDRNEDRNGNETETETENENSRITTTTNQNQEQEILSEEEQQPYFQTLIQVLNLSGTESEKQQEVESFLNGSPKPLTSLQCQQILELFDYPFTQKLLATRLYEIVTDKVNFEEIVIKRIFPSEYHRIDLRERIGLE